MSLAIPTKLDKKLVKVLDRLVSEGLYVSRSEAIRDSIRKLVANQYISLHRFLHTIAEITSETITTHLGNTITDIILYGSVARNEATPNSDIDLLILTKHKKTSKIRKKLHEIIYPISLASSTPITTIITTQQDFTTWTKNKLSFAQEIIKQGIQLHGDILTHVRS